MERARTVEDAALAEAGRPRMQTFATIVVEVVERVEEVEAGDPEQDGGTEHPRLPRSTTGDGEPGADRREPEAGAEPEVAEPRVPLEVRVDDEHRHRNRPQPADDRVELKDGDEEDRECGRAQTRAPAWASASRSAARDSRCAGSARRARRRSSRFSAIASVRAPTMATVTQTRSLQPGHAPAARKTPAYANGSANTVCSMRTSDARRRGRGTAELVTSADAESLDRRRPARARGGVRDAGPRSRPGILQESPGNSRPACPLATRPRHAREARAAFARGRLRGSPRRCRGPVCAARRASPRESRHAERSPCRPLSVRATHP